MTERRKVKLLLFFLFNGETKSYDPLLFFNSKAFENL